jgi:integrase/recombinase XerD
MGVSATGNLIATSVADLIAQLPSPRSRRAYRDDWAAYCRWLSGQGIAVEIARPRHVGGYLARMRDEKRAKKSISRALSVLREVYGALVRDEIMETNPAREVKSPKIDSAPSTPFLTEDQLRKLFDWSAESWRERRDLMCIQLLLGIGWRRSETARMCVEDFKNGTVTGILKGNKPYTAGVPDWLQAGIASWCEYAGISEGPLLPRALGNRKAISGDIVFQIMKTITKRVGLPHFSPHAIRRTKITIEGERGISLKIRQLSVGHASQATTELYDHARDAAKNAPGNIFADFFKR